MYSVPAVTFSACSREGEGIGEAFAQMAWLALVALGAALLVGLVWGALAAHRRDAGAWGGAAAGAAKGFVVVVALAVGTWLYFVVAANADYERVRNEDAWLHPIGSAEPGMMAATIESVRRAAPPHHDAPRRLGVDVANRLLAADLDWTEADLAAAAAYQPASPDLAVALLWARHGLPELRLATAEVEASAHAVGRLGSAAAWSCRNALSRCRERGNAESFRLLEARLRAVSPDHHVIGDLVRAREAAFPPPK